MNIGFKRIAAYLIDIVLVSIIVFMITNSKINFQLKEYNKTYKEYNKIYEKHEKAKDKYEHAKERYQDKKTSKKKVQDTKKEYKIAQNNYKKCSKKYAYNLAKKSVFSTSVSIIVALIYFGVIQYLLKGQTLGKKMLKLKVVKSKDGKLSIFNFLIRSFILNSIWANLILLIGVNIFNADSYYTLNYCVSNILYIVELIILIMVFMDKDARGLHDYIAGTKVVSN